MSLDLTKFGGAPIPLESIKKGMYKGDQVHLLYLVVDKRYTRTDAKGNTVFVMLPTAGKLKVYGCLPKAQKKAERSDLVVVRLCSHVDGKVSGDFTGKTFK